MQFYADRLDEYCDPQDPVCCSSGANILAHLSYFTPQNSDAIANYVAAKFNAAR
ncbi:uncharacterized protein K489DRAFT_384414 [Dissoconium aciculare CBS 342.82]|jgi:hypothetical protein|uniref:Uncharacterized protein n=1 Tax=Dissoconium aciculare CBS 342.82 TaxID=1314786 RepID=A0A6J3LUG9_9PEZI|nr:uncharacterized protein K489DRAFT_384414 [Dissoconium aciculare CBS 342.82]KAF1818919.1 hypothetical protein K489DRAFT_384414 [Dissoconium aciculare CBS 342.82]